MAQENTWSNKQSGNFPPAIKVFEILTDPRDGKAKRQLSSSRLITTGSLFFVLARRASTPTQLHLQNFTIQKYQSIKRLILRPSCNIPLTS